MFEAERAFVRSQLSRDSLFLRDLNIMDYSLLLCIEKRDPASRSSSFDKASEFAPTETTISVSEAQTHQSYASKKLLLNTIENITDESGLLGR